MTPSKNGTPTPSYPQCCVKGWGAVFRRSERCSSFPRERAVTTERRVGFRARCRGGDWSQLSVAPLSETLGMGGKVGVGADGVGLRPKSWMRGGRNTPRRMSEH